MIKKIIYLVVLILLSLCVIESVRIMLADKFFYPIVSGIAKNSTNYDLKVNCGRMKLFAKDYDVAEEIFVDIIENAPILTDKAAKYKAFYELGNVYYETEQYIEAAKAYELVLRNNIKNRKALKKFVRIKMAQKDYITAYRFVNTYVKEKPNDAFGHAEKCAILTRFGKFSAARVSCEKAIEIRKGYARAHYDYAVLLKSQGFNDLAQKEYDLAISHSRHIKSRGELEKSLNLKPIEQETQPF